ncbi:hypothetical protein IWW39_000244 [Coemansia spiralis]|uniref:Uncharacterized protein n=1 Tax=Coemansia spiralis TaxID=417178 RepID=A0A9W8L5J6_9FUNG|nr:hypothetical protein IWW39_000244 [Coemansia spiralis]
MFPSLGLLSQIDCPHKDKCGRGSLCLYRHRPMPAPTVAPEGTAPATPKNKPEPSSQPVAAVSDVQKVTPKDLASASQPAVVVTREPVNSAAATLVESNPVLSEMKERDSVASPVASSPAGDTDAWRALTLNYDTAGPAYNSECETTRVAPQLKAIVGDKIGYAKRQRALTLIYEHTATKTTEGPSWMPAKLSVECEDRIYRESGPGSYHGKLSACLKNLK